MQNLEIIYDESSAQLQYLEQYRLVDQEQIQRHTFDEISQQCTQFQFKQICVEEKTSSVNIGFDQFIEKTLNINEAKFLSSHINFLKCLLCVWMGDVVEYVFIVEDHINKKAIQLLVAYKWTIIIHMLSIFLVISMAPFQYTIIFLWTSFYFAASRNVLQSQILKSVNFKSSINTLVNQLKNLYIERNTKIDSGKLKIILKQFAKALQRRYKLPSQQTPFIMDKIQQLFFRVFEVIKASNYANSFLSKNSVILRKYYFFMLKFQNDGLKDIEQTLSKIIVQLKDIQYEKSSNYLKPFPKKIMYPSNLLYKFQQKRTQQPFMCLSMSQSRNLMKIIKSQVEFKCISKSQRINIVQQLKNEEQEVQNKNEETSCYIQLPKPQIRSYYLEDNLNITRYEVQDVEVIKNKLNHLFKEKLQKQEKVKQKAWNIQKPHIQKFQKPIFSFGIPIVPPKRDMEAYYLK